MRWVAALLLVSLTLAGRARADDVDVARARFREGVAYFDKGQYDLARAAFLEAWALKKHPAILLQLAQSCLGAHHDAEAARYFVLLRARTDATPDERSQAEKGLAEARAHDARLEIHAPPGEVLVDGESVGVAPLPEAVDVEPGAHTVKSGAAHTVERRVTVQRGDRVVVELATTPPPPAPPPPAAPKSPPAVAPAAPLSVGGEGESCRARSDCARGLVCVRNTCADASIGQPCTSGDECGGTLACVDRECAFEAAEPKPTAPGFDAKALHPFAGAALRTGPAWALATGSAGGGNDTSLRASFLFALRAGVLVGPHEVAVEIAPFTDLPYTGIPFFNGTAFQAVATYGYLVPLFENATVTVAWPLRVGLGIMAGGNNTSGQAFFVARADLVGVAARFGHVLLSVELPSFGYAVTSASFFGGSFQLHVLAWQGGMTAAYAF